MDFKLKILIGLFLFTLLAIVIWSVVISNRNRSKVKIREIESYIAIKDKKSTDLLKQLSSTEIKDFKKFDNVLVKNRSKSKLYEDIEIFIYDNDSLIFWSSNALIPPPGLINKDNALWHSGNGWYRLTKKKEKNYSFFSLYLIKYDYKHQNQYLQNYFNPIFELPDNASIEINQTKDYSINDLNGNYLFSISISDQNQLKYSHIMLLATLYIISIILILTILLKFAIYRSEKFQKPITYLITYFAFSGLLMVLFNMYLFPNVIYQTKIFEPYYYAYSDFIPSLGNLFLSSLFVLFISICIHRLFGNYIIKIQLIWPVKITISVALILLSFILFEVVNFVIESLVIDSKIMMDLNNIFNLNLMSLLSFFIISMALSSYILISHTFIKLSYSLLNQKYFYLVIFLVLLLILSIYVFTDGQINSQIFYCLIYTLTIGYLYSKKSYQFNINKIVAITIIFSVYSTHYLHNYNTIKEKEHRKLLAVNLSAEQRDLVSEFLFQNERDNIFNDSIIKNFFAIYGRETFNFEQFETYFFENYFKEQWNKFEIQITICSNTDILNIQPENREINCVSYFADLIDKSTIQTEYPELFFINYGPGENGYLSVFDFTKLSNEGSQLLLFIEFFPKISTQKLGFPDLLIDQSVAKLPSIAGYSYAKYEEGNLYKRVGSYFYDIKFDPTIYENEDYSFFTLNGFDHLLYSIDNKRFLIISNKEKKLLDILAPFSYLFILFLLTKILIISLFIDASFLKKARYSFKTKVQLSISSVLLFSFLSIGFFTLYYIYNLNNNKNEDILSEKTHSVLVEMQHKFLNINSFDESIKNYVSNLLVKFSNVFFTDINLFDLNGNLIATSRPQIFDEKLISKRMEPEAFIKLRFEEKSFLIQNENIGKQEYLSAYIPFSNDVGEIIGYLNLPYFAKETELNREISNLLVVFINIYVILIGISLIIAIIISNYVSRPVRMIIEKIKLVKLGRQNETLALIRKDEIGELVKEYNRMINELAKSTELLAKSEREYAWREMAKQVAHEIKNPLTPMKLSVQHLQRAWKNSDKDWDQRLEKFTQNMIEQIDSLSTIATEFSDFAKMPAGKKNKTDLVDSITNSLKLFRNYDQIKILFNYDKNENYYVIGDKEQLSRVFNNLLNNAIQAIGSQKNGMIELELQKKNNFNEISISDNGSGIPDEISTKIFSPNFTTKSGGMGLGLAIAKSIITSGGGEITFTSKKSTGTRFTIKLPSVEFL
jgi:two-component system, NtrC family, nitrogen regulation sensor histidine kinase NtrY